MKLRFIPDGFADPILDLSTFKEITNEHVTEKEFIQNDTVRKFQIDYDESICMVEKFPEAMHVENLIGHASENNTDPNQLLVIAPGEGKTPTNIAYCEDWDAKAFPMLHPDG